MEISRIWYEITPQETPESGHHRHLCVEMEAAGVPVLLRSPGVEANSEADRMLDEETVELLSELGRLGASPSSIASALHELDRSRHPEGAEALLAFGIAPSVGV